MNGSSAPLPDAPETATAVRFRWRVLVLAALFFGLLLPKLASGTLYHHDELYTANRAREILVRGDPWTITRNLAPDFRKPPLQYWLCAGALRLWPDHRELAVRLPSLAYGAACLLALGWLARRCHGDEDPDTGLAAVVALAGCGYFVHFSRVALLDTGAALHLTLAVAGCQLARRDPRWWWFVGLQSVLGAWQKAPFAFAAWGIILLVRGGGGAGLAGRRAWLNPHLLAALGTSLVAASSWWLLQAYRHGFDALRETGAWQTQALGVAHDAGDVGFRPWVYWIFLARDWALPGLCAPLMLFGVLRRRRRSDDPLALAAAATAEIAWICAAFALGLLLIPYRAERYLVVFTPLLALLVVRWVRDMASRMRYPLAQRWVLSLVLASTLPVASFHYLSAKPVKADLLAASRELGRTLRSDENAVVTAEADPAFEVPGFVGFYADLTRPLRELTPAEIHASTSPLHGICRRRQWAELTRAEPAVHEVFTRGDWIVWTR